MFVESSPEIKMPHSTHRPLFYLCWKMLNYPAVWLITFLTNHLLCVYLQLINML